MIKRILKFVNNAMNGSSKSNNKKKSNTEYIDYSVLIGKIIPNNNPSPNNKLILQSTSKSEEHIKKGNIYHKIYRRHYPHLYIKTYTTDPNEHWSLCINIIDSIKYAHIKDLDANFLDIIKKKDPGVYKLESIPNTGALDYIRSGFLKKDDFKTLTDSENFKNQLENILVQIQKHPESKIFCLGSKFINNNYLGHKCGIHLIHMNQGQDSYKGNEYKDGSLILYDGTFQKYHGFFFYFKEEESAWNYNTNIVS